jgi:hypothetical protein
MLTEHAQAFGRKTIESVRALKDVSPQTMYFVLSEAEIPLVTPRILESRAKRLSLRSAEAARKLLQRNPSRDGPPGSHYIN